MSTFGFRSLRAKGVPRSSLAVVRSALHLFFGTFLVLTLATPSWREGPFTWLPLWRSPMLAGAPVTFGVLGLLPVLIAVIFSALRYVERGRRPWHWGSRGIALPLLGLTALALVGLDASLTWRTVVQLVGFGLLWLVVLVVLNEEPGLIAPLALVIMIQGSVALGQFLRQSDLGLGVLGEPTLDPSVQGISVLWARDQRWLRAYGLTSHPNLLGATLVVSLLFLTQPLVQTKGWRRVGLTVVACVGVLGLLATFSRASWLAFGVGLTIWISGSSRRFWSKRRDWKPAVWNRATFSDLPLHLLAPIVLAGIFFVFNYDLATSRFVRLDTPIEAHSLEERQRDSDLALSVIADHPWRGVGAGNYLAAIRSIEPDSRPVHNVPLLVTAELGLVGAAFLLWFTISGLRGRPEARAPWLAMLVIGFFDSTLWLTTSWRAAILVGLLVATVSVPAGSHCSCVGEDSANH